MTSEYGSPEDFIQQNMPNADIGQGGGLADYLMRATGTTEHFRGQPIPGGKTAGPQNPAKEGMIYDKATDSWVKDTSATSISEGDRLSMLTKQFSDGKLKRRDFMDKLLNLGYDPKDIDLIANTAEKAKNVPTDALFEAYSRGNIDRNMLAQKLGEAGLEGDDLNIYLDLADDEQADYKKKNPPTKEMGQNAILDLYKRGQGPGGTGAGIDYATAKQKLMQEEGYSEVDADMLLRKTPEVAPEKQRAAAPQQQQRAGVAPGTPRPQARARAQSFAGGGGPTIKPQAPQVLNDFRTAFAQNLKSQGAGLSLGAKQWAMDNQDLFLNDYLGSKGIGQPETGAAFTMGAQQIQSLYEGMKGNRMAAGRTGGGASQARML